MRGAVVAVLLASVLCAGAVDPKPQITTRNSSIVLVAGNMGDVVVSKNGTESVVALQKDVDALAKRADDLNANVDFVAFTVDTYSNEAAAESAATSIAVDDLSQQLKDLERDKADADEVASQLATLATIDSRDSLSSAISSAHVPLSDAIKALEDDKADNDAVTAAFGERVTNSEFDALSSALSTLHKAVSDKVEELDRLKASQDELNAGLASRATNERVDQVEASLTDSWPPLETFADTPSGWKDQTGADFTATLACGAYGNVLGGFENYNRDLRLAKTYTLPVHSGVQIELDYFFIDSWDNEFAQIYVDGALVWRQRRYFRDASDGELCGRSGQYHELVEHVLIQVPDHTAKTLTLTVTSTLNDVSTDESFGFSNVRIGPIAPAWPSTALFGSGYTEQWEGSGAGLTSCGEAGTILGGTTAGAGTILTRTYEYLPSHQGLRLQFRLFYLDAWPSGASVMVHLDGRLLYKGAKPSAQSDICLGSGSDAVVLVDVTHDVHSSSTAFVRISTDLPTDDEAAHFGISDVVLNEPVAAWPGLIDFEKDADRIGWSAAAKVTSCGGLGNVMGGYDQLGQGEYLEKTFHNLPVHKGITLSLRYLFIDTWDGDEAGLIYVDGELISQPVHNQYPSSSYCGQSGNADNIADLVFHLPDHVSHTLTLRIGSTLSSAATDESFAVDNINIAPYIPTWPTLDTFSSGIDGWTSNKAPLRTTTCGGLGSILGGFMEIGGGHRLQKTYRNLPVHTGLHITLDAIAIDSWDAETFIVEIEGSIVWTATRSARTRGAQHCGSANDGWYETRYPVDVVIPHTADEVEITVRTTLDSSPADESFGIDNVHIGPPPTETWPVVDTFEGSSTNGWAGFPANEVTPYKCGDYGFVLGGYNNLGGGHYVEKTFGPLPPHVGLVVEMTVYYIDTWDSNERIVIEVDGAERWAELPPGSGSATNKCGLGTEDRVRFAHVEIAGHYSSHVQVRVRNTLNQAADDESMAIDDIRVMPLV